jgi:sugar/nucleoside kinase (ribokinase family)
VSGSRKDIVEASALTALSEDSPPEALLSALQARVPETWIVVTLGAAGLVFAAPGALPELRRTRALSGPSHGVGDCFISTLAAAYLSGQDFGAALDSAQRTSAAHIAQSRPSTLTAVSKDSPPEALLTLLRR